MIMLRIAFWKMSIFWLRAIMEANTAGQYIQHSHNPGQMIHVLFIVMELIIHMDTQAGGMNILVMVG